MDIKTKDRPPLEILVRMPLQLATAIRRARRGLGMTQAQLGALAGVRQATISNLESGETDVQMTTLYTVMAVLDLEMVIRTRTGNKD